MQLVKDLDRGAVLRIGRVALLDLGVFAVLRLVERLYACCVDGHEVILAHEEVVSWSGSIRLEAWSTTHSARGYAMPVHVPGSAVRDILTSRQSRC